ncbi:ribose 5-phosphate isomerase A [Staphylococcus felis]|uniref:Ribose-5-phosphate isomerase A n=1 Tax=Staphylococcus felis TaxID=46127 RepID=A0ABS0QP98_9STAP|nr:ribose 5-phosphate isomerase A [Staphylococcus felis]AVP36419.1 ribose 5-phosphate isomerase A [Staphylococcus felis]MBH9581071.1 ribose 5-phosphate isomerase A [Staphylococcus felis]MDM8326865.1 ribose 5-phosphate isomerase A [Staphylococcus felis]MDQ7192665.1 ribose 5-phosphate isomerase A [Staphylococcus felis]PNZ35029.1 ribose-5-phosphate isomerase [Staphylococcus felis]
MDTQQLKMLTLDDAVAHIKDGMTLGIGTGSTIELLVPEIAKLISEKGYRLKGVCTSERTEYQAKSLNIPIVHINDVTHIDLAIDGADEIDPQLNLIKGGGGALFREKVIDEFAETFIVLADQTKLVDYLGQTFKLPVEVDRFNWYQVAQKIEQRFQTSVQRRMVEDTPLITDNGNYILDCGLTVHIDPYEAHEFLIHLTGVLETGYFLDIVDKAIIGTEQGVKVFHQSL